MLCLCRQTHKKNSISLKGKCFVPYTKERWNRTQCQNSQGFSPRNALLCVWGGFSCNSGDTRSWLGTGNAACPSINPAISELYKQNRKKPLLCKTEEQTFCTGRNNQEFPFPFLVTGRTKQEWKFLNEERKANFFPSKFPQKSPDTYQLMTRYCFLKLAIISSPNFNEFVSSWKRMCQFRG